MAWHVASRSAWSTHGALSNELRRPLDAEYALNGHHSWWQPKQRLGQLLKYATKALDDATAGDFEKELRGARTEAMETLGWGWLVEEQKIWEVINAPKSYALF